MQEQITKLQQQVDELLEWKRARQRQQISYPIDQASQNTLGAAIGNGLGTHALTQNINLTGNPQTITPPAAYGGTIFLVISGETYEVPFL